MLDIIIPTYNNPDNLEESLSSLVSQTNSNFKVTIVDDASAKDYCKIIEEYSSKLNINYIKNSENLGAGLSRQVGVENSSGEYLIYFDDDDRLMPYAVQLIYDLIECNNYPDLIVTPFYTQIFEESKKRGSYKTSILLSNEFRRILTWCHGKVYKRASIEKYDIKTPVKYSRVCDDYYYNTLCAMLLDTQVTSNLPYYLWVQNRRSVTHTRNLKAYEVQNQIMDALLDIAPIALSYNKPIDHIIQIMEVAVNSPNSNRLQDDDKLKEVREFLNKYYKENKKVT